MKLVGNRWQSLNGGAMVSVCKRAGLIIVSMCLAFIVLGTLGYQHAWAYTYPSPNKIWFDGQALSQNVPEGVTYDEGSGILTLENYHGGGIYIDGDACNFDIILKGDNVITVTGVDSRDVAIDFAGTGRNLELYGVEGSSLTVNYTRVGEDSTSGAYAISAGGNLEISKCLDLRINMTGTQSSVVRFVALSSGGDMRIQDHAKVTIVMSAQECKSSYAFNVGSGYAQTLYVTSDQPLYVDMSNMKHSNPSDKPAFMDNQHGDVPFTFTNTPKVTILAEDLVYRGFGGYMRPTVDGYTLVTKTGKFEYTPVALKTGWVKEGGTWYYYNDDGTKKTGWLPSKGKWYYLDKSTGAMLTGWQKVGGKWYYLEPKSGAMRTGWVSVSGKWYYLNEKGAMVTGWLNTGGKWYYLKSNGAMAAKEWCKGYWLNANGTWTYPYKGSWKQNSKGWWFGDTSGWYAKNQSVRINDVIYKFDASGYMM